MSERAPWPLSWPIGKPRTGIPHRSRFGDHTIGAAYNRLEHELRLFGATRVVISTNVETTLDLRPRSNAANPQDCGVAVYFDKKSVRKPNPVLHYCIALDQYNRVACNLYAIALVIDSYRTIYRHGGGELIEQATAGFLALPEAIPLPATKEEKLRALASHPDTPPNEAATARRVLEQKEAQR